VWQLLAFTRGAIGNSGAHHSDMPYDVLTVICALVVAMEPSPSVIDRFVEDKPCCVPRPRKQQQPHQQQQQQPPHHQQQQQQPPASRCDERLLEESTEEQANLLSFTSVTAHDVPSSSPDHEAESGREVFDARGADCLLLHMLRIEEHIPALEEARLIGHLRDQTEEDLVGAGVPRLHARSIVHSQPHQTELLAAVDNKDEPKDLPLALWS
jgi:hypothetical protein